MSKFLDLKSTLKAVDMRDKDFYEQMSDEDKKKYSPYMLMRYAASVKSDQFYTEHYIAVSYTHLTLPTKRIV